MSDREYKACKNITEEYQDNQMFLDEEIETTIKRLENIGKAYEDNKQQQQSV